MKKKILALSDTHGYLPHIEEEFDLLLICGDICPAHDHYYSFQKEWIENEFIDWVNRLPFKNEDSKVILTWGNHDFYGERSNKNDFAHLSKLSSHRLIVLKNEEYDYKYFNDEGEEEIIKIFGTPYCKVFGNWAFMVESETLKKKFAEIPDNLDILISHDAPDLNNFGRILMGRWAGEDASNKELGKAIDEKRPRIALHGHIHSSRHEFKDYDGIWMSCVSYVDEQYNPTYPILSFEYDTNNKEVNYV